MNKKIPVALLVVIILSVAAYCICKQTWKQIPAANLTPVIIDTPQQQSGHTTTDTNRVVAMQNRIAPAQQTYTNNKLGFSFPYPAHWFQNGKEEEAVNLAGATTAVTINFSDSISSTTLSVEYHLAPKGAELYRYSVSQFNAKQGWYAKDGEQIEVAGNKAIEANNTIDKDGRGEPLNPPLKLIVIDFLDKHQTGEIQLQFKTPVTNQSEVAKFKQVVEGFKFTK